MKFLIIFVGLLAFAAAIDLEFWSEEEWNQFMENGNTTSEDFGIILDSSVKKGIKQTLEQMPCGWPEYNIPPLAPYTNPELEVHLAKSFVDGLLKLIRFRLDGLDEMKIKKLKVSYLLHKKVRYHFIFEELKANSTALQSNIFINLMKELGLTIRYNGHGPFEFSLKNLEIQGQFKYKMPIFIGSIKIYKLKCEVSLGGASSNMGGLLGNGHINELINDEIERAIPAYINQNQDDISARIVEDLVPAVNTQLKGKKIWYIIGQIFKSHKPCHPAPAPWLAQE